MSVPNILIFITDQHRADHLGCYGNPVLRTPHIDALASAGVRAERFYAASTTCMSNRATLMTGRLPSVHGVVHNGINLSLDQTTFVELLRDAGYATALIGKSHLQCFGYDHPDKRAWRPVEGRRTPAEGLRDATKRPRMGEGYGNEWTPDWKAGRRQRVDTPYYGFDHVELCTLHGDQVQGDYARWLAERHPDPDSLRGRDHALPAQGVGAPQAWRTRVPEALYPSSYIGERACGWLESLAAQAGPAAPFFLMCSFPDPHHPFTPPGRFWDLYDPADMPLPASFHAPGGSPLVRGVHDYGRGGGTREGYTAFPVSERECREITALTYGMIGLIDEQVGRVMATLDRLGLRENTLVIFTSDHGDMMGDHGVMLKGPMHYQGVVRVPFIWSDPALPETRRGTVCEAPAGTLDIAGTVLDRAGIAAYNGMQGLSLREALERGAPLPRPGVLVENEPVMFQFGRPRRFRLRTLLTGQWRITQSDDRALCELYDLEKDPLELRNLWDDPGAASRRAELTDLLLAAMIEHADASPLPAGVA